MNTRNRLRVLVLIASPILEADGLTPVVRLDVAAERQRMDEVLRRADPPLDVTFLPATARALQEVLLEGADVLHFVGHGGQKALGFETEEGLTHPVDADLLRDLTAGKGLRLALLNACHFGSVAEVMKQAGIPAIVAVERSEGITDEAAIAFSGGFYAALGRGHTLASAFGEGKLAVRCSDRLGVEAKAEADKYDLLAQPGAEGIILLRRAEGGYRATAPVCRHNLPPRPQIFLGREREMVDTNRALLGKERVVVLRGEGGIGKTALAREVAAWQAERGRFPGGVAWVDLQTPRPLASIVEEIGAAVLGEAFRRAAADRAQLLREHLAGRATLIVLDNFETVRDDPLVLGFVGSLPAPSAAILTSRQRVRAGQVQRVRELKADDAAQLFIQWAGRAGWDGRGDGAQVQALCAELGYMPLAIELLAPQAAALTLATLLRRVQRSLAAVADERPGLPKRHQSVVAALGISYEGLSDGGKRFFPRLAVFPGGAWAYEFRTPDGAVSDAIRFVCGVDDWEPAAAELVDKGLARLEGQRYVLHPMVRRYGLELLERSGEREAVERRAAGFFLDLAEFASSVVGSEQARFGLAIVEAERANLLWGQEWWMEQGSKGAGEQRSRGAGEQRRRRRGNGSSPTGTRCATRWMWAAIGLSGGRCWSGPWRRPGSRRTGGNRRAWPTTWP